MIIFITYKYNVHINMFVKLHSHLRPFVRAATGEGRLAGERKRVIKPYANILYNTYICIGSLLPVAAVSLRFYIFAIRLRKQAGIMYTQ